MREKGLRETSRVPALFRVVEAVGKGGMNQSGNRVSGVREWPCCSGREKLPIGGAES